MTAILCVVIFFAILYCLIIVSIVQTQKNVDRLSAHIHARLDKLKALTNLVTKVKNPGELLGKKVIYIGETTIIGGVVYGVYAKENGNFSVDITVNLIEPQGTSNEHIPFIREKQHIYFLFSEYGKTLFLQEDVLKTTTEV